MGLRHTIPWAAILGVATGCGDVAGDGGGVRRSQHAIYGGEIDNGDPAVVALTDEWGYYFCTGTIVDPMHVVTAAHCIAGSAPPQYVFSCTNSNNSDPYSDPQCYLGVSGSTYHPEYDENLSTSAHDIGVLTLDSPTSINPKPLPTESLDASAIGTEVRLVGFGDDEYGGSGVKRQANATIDELDEGTFTMWGVPNHCYGDSGGPGFWPAGAPGEALVGVTSAGVTDDCAGGGIDTMVGDNLDWLASVGVDVPMGSGAGGSSSGPSSSATTGSGSGTSSGPSGAGGGGFDPDPDDGPSDDYDDDDEEDDDDGSSKAGPGHDASSGCATRSAGGGAGSWWLVAAIALLASRRNRSKRARREKPSSRG